MSFDPVAYRTTYLEPRARQKPPTLSDDLLERYAIVLPSTDAEVAAAVKGVRSTWMSQLKGTRAEKYANLCSGADEQLRAQHGDAMLTASWWTAQAKRSDEASDQMVDQLAALLTSSYGAFGLITQPYLDTCAATLGLSDEKARAAARKSDLRILSGEELPESSPLDKTQYSSLEGYLAAAGVNSIVHLIHPKAHDFSILEKFESPELPDARLDGEAVGNQLVEASRLAVGPANDARRRSLDMLKTFCAGGDLAALALYNIAEIAKRSAGLGAPGIRLQLVKLGVAEADASAIAVLAAEAGVGGARAHASRVEQLLAEGRLIEAAQTVPDLPDTVADKESLVARIAEARVRYDTLIGEAMRLVSTHDEVGALAKVRDARAISAEEADDVLTVVPLPPPLGVVIGADGVDMRLHWRLNIGHTDETTFIIRRAENAAPSTVLDGSAVNITGSDSAGDQHAPVARELFYSVFATAPGRPHSRSATASMVLTPAPDDLHAEIGATTVAVRWAGHTGANGYQAVRRHNDGRSEELTVTDNSVTLRGLEEGSPVTVDVTAEYRSPAGQVIRSGAASITATPRSEARPIELLRARPFSSGRDGNVAISWQELDSADVRIRRSDDPGPWSFGTWVTTDDFARFGEEVTGLVDRKNGEVTLHARLREGRIHHLTPFSIGGTGIVAGRSAVVGIAEAVHGVEAVEFADFARLTWLWPSAASLAEVSWERDAEDPDAVGLVQIKKSEYDRDGGFTVPLACGRTKIQVRALITVAGEKYSSPPALVEVRRDSLIPSVSYTLVRTPRIGIIGGRGVAPSFSSSTAVRGAQIALVAARGHVMPMSPDDGVLVKQFALTLDAGQTLKLDAVQVPRSVVRPFWLRCFSIDDQVELIDPPMNQLKET